MEISTLASAMVFAVLAIIFGIFNIVLWLFVLKQMKAPSAKKEAGPSQEVLITALQNTEERLAELISRSRAGGGSREVLESLATIGKKLEGVMFADTVSIQETLENLKTADLPGTVEGLKQTVEPLKNGLESLNKNLDNLEKGMADLRRIFESIDGNIVKLNRRISGEKTE